MIQSASESRSLGRSNALKFITFRHFLKNRLYFEVGHYFCGLGQFTEGHNITEKNSIIFEKGFKELQKILRGPTDAF